MNERPRAVTIAGWLFVVVGVISLSAHLLPRVIPALPRNPETTQQLGLAVLSAILALVAGVFTLRGNDWARWLCVAWMGFHVILSFWHTLSELLVHALLFVGVLYLLLRPSSAAFFKKRESVSAD